MPVVPTYILPPRTLCLSPSNLGEGDFIPLFALLSYVSVWEGAESVGDVTPRLEFLPRDFFENVVFRLYITNALAKHRSTRPRFPLDKPDFFDRRLAKSI